MAALITAGSFLPPVFMAGGAAGLSLGSVAAGALSGAVASGGLSILAGEKPKDFLKSAAFGAAMGALGGKLQQGKFEAKAFQQTVDKAAGGTGFVVKDGIQYNIADTAGQNALAKQFGAQLVTDPATKIVTPVFPGQYQATFADAATGAKGGVRRLVEGSTLATEAANVGIGASSKYGDYATQAAISAGVNTGMTVLKDQAYQALADDPPVALGGSARQYYNGTRNAVANLTRNYISSGTPSGDSTAAIYASMANNLSYGTGSIDYNQNAGLSLLRGISIPTLRYT